MQFIRMIPMIFVMGIISFLSHQPGDSLELPGIPFVDKFLHLGIYCILSLAVSYALPPGAWRKKNFTAFAGVVLFCLFYGIIDEYHQSFIPGRFSSWYDIAADGAGAFLGAAGYCRLKKKQLPIQLSQK